MPTFDVKERKLPLTSNIEERKRQRQDTPVEPTSYNIDPLFNAGGANLTRLKDAAEALNCPYGRLAIGVLTDKEVFDKNVLPDSLVPPATRDVADPIMMTELQRIGMFSTWHFKFPIMGTVRIFLIAKKNSAKRIIVHPKWFNEVCRKHPKFHLWGAESMIFYIARFAGSPLYIIELDLRNYFYQMGIGAHIQAFFCILCKAGGKWAFFALQVLCMGWKWSPFLSQCISFLLILFKFPNEEDLFEHVIDPLSEAPPSVIFFPSGFVTIIYDNYLILTTDCTLRDKIQKRIIRNMEWFCIKEKYINTSVNEFSYNGMEVRKTRHLLEWRTCSKTFENWVARCNDDNLKKTGANLAALQNTLVAHVTGRQGSLRPHARLFATTGKVFRWLASQPRKMWKRPLKDSVLNNEHFSTLRQSIASTLTNEWCTFTKTPIPNIFSVIVVDATPIGLGITFIDIKTERLLYEKHIDIDNTDIATAESVAINTGLKTYKAMFGLPLYGLLILGSDSTPAGRAFAKGWSGVEDIDTQIAMFDEIKEDRIFMIVDLPTQENVADEASRDLPCTEEKLKATVTRIKKAIRIRRKGLLWIDRHLTHPEADQK